MNTTQPANQYTTPQVSVLGTLVSLTEGNVEDNTSSAWEDDNQSMK